MSRSIPVVSLAFVLVLGSACGGTSANGSTSSSSTAANRGGVAQGSYGDDASRRDEEAFTRRFVEDFGRRAPEEGCTYAGVRTLACGDAQLSLDRVWEFCVDNTSECDPVIADFGDAMAEALAARRAPSGVDATQLRVALRTRAYGDDVSARVDGSIVRPIAGDVVAVVMVDSPRSARAFGGDDATSIGLSSDEAYARALANTLGEMPPLEGVVPRCGQVRAIQNDYYYESSRILDAAWLASLRGNGSESILVSVPSYDAVVVALECDPASRLVMGQVGAGIAQRSSTPLSTTIFRADATGLVPAR